MDKQTKNELAGAGIKAGATLFGRLMDLVAAKRPNGLVARFRKRLGRITPEQIERTAQRVRDVVKGTDK